MKMKIPNTPADNGYYNNQDIIPYLSDNEEENTDEADSPTIDGDFSEYMWMENEEEFDNQVMKQLEEEALMEQCIEAMLEDERDGAPGQGGDAPRTAGCQPWSNGDIGPSHLAHTLESLSVSDDLAKGSKLNPNAMEFIPRAPCSGKPIEGKV